MYSFSSEYKTPLKLPLQSSHAVYINQSIRNTNILTLPISKNDIVKPIQSHIEGPICNVNSLVNATIGRHAYLKRASTENEPLHNIIEIVIFKSKHDECMFPIYSNMSMGNCTNCSINEMIGLKIPQVVIPCEEQGMLQMAICSMRMISDEGVCSFNKKYSHYLRSPIAKY